MPGTYIFKPVEAKLTHDTVLIGKMNPYCAFNIGGTKIKSQVCMKGGKYPHWDDTIIIPIADESLYSEITVQLMDKERLLSDDNIGDFVLDLQEVQTSGQVSKWYPISFNDQPAGEILIEATYTQGFNTLDEQGKVHCDEEAGSITAAIQQPASVFTEQKQIIEPHTFVKEVEVVETRPKLQEIEVMEPVKVIKQVQVTEPVVVTKMVETIEPEVVVKEVEVMEPRLITKTIQVVEDVPVTRQVEVVEMKTTYKEVETVESKTYDKEVEVIEYRPVKKEVEVSEPVTIKKSVEYVEPVVTTVTVTKVIPQAVIVGEDIVTEVGPATVIDKQGDVIGEVKVMKEEIIGLEEKGEIPVIEIEEIVETRFVEEGETTEEL